jgi:putative flippase GtrA
MTSAKQPEAGQSERRKEARRIGDAALSLPASISDLAGWIAFLRQLTFIRYTVVSIAALIADMCVFLALLKAGTPSTVAAAIGYTIGILAHWLLSSRKVFQDRVSERGTAERRQQKAMFVISALLGLAITMAIVGLGEALGLDPRIAKIMAIGTSFVLTYLLRNVVIFRAGNTA